MYRYVDNIAWGATAAVTIDVGFSNRLGLPVKCEAMVSEIKNGALTANAGIFVAGLANNVVSTASTTDPRGYYLPQVVVPNGTNTFEIRCIADTSNLHGNRHFG